MCFSLLSFKLQSERHQIPLCRAAVATEGKLQTPHGGQLINLLLPPDQVKAESDSCTRQLELSDRNACDVELLCVG